MTCDEYWFWICNIDGIWIEKIKRLISVFENPKNIFYANENELKNCGFKDEDVLKITQSRKNSDIRNNFQKLKEKGIHFITWENENYPEKLRKIENPPFSLYCKGNIDKINHFTVAIIGARNCSEYGKANAKEIAFHLASHGVNIVSGMAHGIDSLGQWGAIEANGFTYAVLGSGVDICYPRENIELYEMIQKNGAILSEYPVSSQPVGWHFPMRNRIISGLCDKLLVIEAKEKSGSLITVEYALEQGKDIYAVPGRISDRLAVGCNRLIKEGAGLVTSANDILEEIKFESKKLLKREEKKNFILEKELESLYSNLSYFPKAIQEIVDETGKSPEEVVRILVKLQMMDLVKETTKNCYSRNL